VRESENKERQTHRQRDRKIRYCIGDRKSWEGIRELAREQGWTGLVGCKAGRENEGERAGARVTGKQKQGGKLQNHLRERMRAGEEEA
jgi:hypothetical protein